MLTAEWPSVSVCRRGSGAPGSDPLRTVVWVRGEHDVATRVHLSATLARAARLDDSDVAVDLSGVTFMDASTIGALVLARSRLRARSRSLCVRAPSAGARRLLDLCGLEGMIDEFPAPLRPLAAPALDSWVAVPAPDQVPSSTQPLARPDTTRAPVRPAARRVESAVSVLQGRSSASG